jgi:hypothetical protein
MERQGAPNNSIKVTASTPPHFSAVFVGIDNPSQFSGEVRTRQQTALSLTQQEDGVGFTAFHIGSRQGELDEYVGAYADVANGFSGRFRMVRTS